MKIFKVVIIFLFFGGHLLSQNTHRLFKEATEKGNHLEIKVSDGTYRIEFYNPQIIETSFINTVFE